MKKYIIIAGVNGCGKSTLYQMQETLKNMPRINTDEILKEFGDWRNISDIMKAGKIAVRKLNKYLESEITFNQETTLCGKSIMKTIREAKNKGYYIEMHYIGVDSVEIVKDRISYRVKNGGHGIPEKDVERRYVESFHGLLETIPLCNLVALYDNTESFRRFSIYRNGERIRLSKNIPHWYSRIIN